MDVAKGREGLLILGGLTGSPPEPNNRIPKSYPTGTIDLRGTFETGKHYAALVTLGDAKTQVLKTPIQVLEPPGRQLAPVAAAVVLVTVILDLLQRRRLPFGRRGSRRSRKG